MNDKNFVFYNFSGKIPSFEVKSLNALNNFLICLDNIYVKSFFSYICGNNVDKRFVF